MPYLTIKEAAEIMNVTPRSVYRRIAAGKLAIEDLTPEGLTSKSFKRARSEPHCSTCGTRHNLVTRRGKPAYECRRCAAERMYRARH